MSLLASFRQQLIDAVKGRDSVRAETLRFLLSAIGYAQIAKYGKVGEAGLVDEDVVGVIKKQVKTHKESIDAFTRGGRSDLVEKEKAQLVILTEFLPKELTDEELTSLLVSVAASGEKNFGLLMKRAMEVVGAKAEGGRVAAILKQMLPK